MQREILYTFSKSLGFPFRKGYGRIVKMKDDIQKVGGELTFQVTINKNGWQAVCEEFPGIITGSPNSNPTQKEINSLVRDALFSAYAIPPYLCDPRFLQTDNEILEQIKKRQKAETAVRFNSEFAYGL